MIFPSLECMPGDARENGLVLGCLHRLLDADLTLGPFANDDDDGAVDVDALEEDFGISHLNAPFLAQLMELTRNGVAPPRQSEEDIFIPPNLGTLVGFRGLEMHQKYLQSSTTEELIEETKIGSCNDDVAKADRLLLSRLVTLFYWPGVLNKMP